MCTIRPPCPFQLAGLEIPWCGSPGGGLNGIGVPRRWAERPRALGVPQEGWPFTGSRSVGDWPRLAFHFIPMLVLPPGIHRGTRIVSGFFTESPAETFSPFTSPRTKCQRLMARANPRNSESWCDAYACCRRIGSIKSHHKQYAVDVFNGSTSLFFWTAFSPDV